MRTAILLATVSAITLCHGARAEGPSHVKVAQCGPLIRQELRVIVGHPLVVVFPKGETTWLNPSSGVVTPDGTKPINPVIEVIREDKLKSEPIGNLFTLWPDFAGTSTLTIITHTADSSIKTYPFTLTALADETAALADPTVTLSLLCSDNPVAKSATTASVPTVHVTPALGAVSAPVVHPVMRQPKMTPAEKAEAEERLRTGAYNAEGDLACHYHAKGKHPSAVEPMCPMDNGQWTLLRFKGLTRKPAVYIGSCENSNDEERLARQHGAGDFVVVEEIAERFCLRLGSSPNDVLEIVNDHYDPVGSDPGTGSTSPGVRRDLIKASAR